MILSYSAAESFMHVLDIFMEGCRVLSSRRKVETLGTGRSSTMETEIPEIYPASIYYMKTLFAQAAQASGGRYLQR
ncbi:hypothetical protein KEJ51_08465 [Candidatus Bathyarchaeota archaeon]|nr:hypothetical protein [Candidatus Bathyarchaeota archaeon]MBS7629122.1 hypothetical protein [Candidatus Bathyarchaeota archaeon]